MALLLVLIGAVWMPRGQAEELPRETELRVAVLAFRGTPRALERWSATMDYLSAEIPGYRFKAIPFDLQGLDKVVIDGEIDFAITNAGQFVRLGAKYGLSWLATLKSRRHQGRGPVIGSALVVRSDRPLYTLQALEGLRLGAVDPLAFGGFQIYWGEMVSQGYRPEHFFSDIRFSGFPVDRLVDWLATDEVDAAVLPACLLESMAAEGDVDPAAFRVLDQKAHTGFACQASTPLYPNWSFSKLRSTPDTIAEKVARVLLAMPPDSRAAKESSSLGWTAPVSSLEIHQLYQQLNIHPWQQPWWRSAVDWLRLNWQWGVIFFVVVVLGFLHHLWVQILVGRRTRQLEQINQELRHQQQQLEHAQRVAILGELSSDLAHELKQPLAAINSYAEGGAVRLDQHTDSHDIIGLLGRISTQARRGAQIIERIRTFAKKGELNREPVNLNNLISETVNLLDYELRKQGITPELVLPKRAVICSTDQLEIQQLLVNLLRNSLDAMEQNTDSPRLRVSLTRETGERISITVEDNGHGIGKQDPEALFKPFYSTKRNGLGLGMAICRRILESHQGSIRMEAVAAGGTRVICSIPGAADE